MATATPSRPAPAATPPADRPPDHPGRVLRAWALAVGVTVGVAALLWLVYEPTYVNYDAQWALTWARDAWHGFLPEYKADFAPTPHPLATAVSSLALPFGAQADTVILWLTLLSFGALVYLTYRLGAELFGRWAGVVAALVIASRPVMMRDALIGYQDVPFAALVIGAVLLEAQRPRRGVPVLVLLALAGLLRPEAWILGGLYWLYLWPAATARERVRSAAVVAAAPLIWATSDLVVTGDPLHSLHGTAALAEEADRRRDPEDVPFWTVQYFAFALREPLMLGIPIGLAFAWLYVRRRALLPLAAVAAMLAVFAAGPLFGLPLIRRYIETPAVLMTLFYGLAVCGFLLLPRGRARTGWMVIGGVAAVLSIAYLPSHVSQLDRLDGRVRLDGAMYRHLERVGHSERVRAAFERCAPLTAGDHRPIPFIRFWLGGEPGSVRTVEGGAAPTSRLLLLPRRSPSTGRIYNQPGEFPKAQPPDGYSQIFRNQSWRVYAAPGC